MELIWGEAGTDGIQRGHDEDGNAWAETARSPLGGYTAWVHSRGCGKPGGVSLKGFATRADAQDAVERRIEEYLSQR